MSAALPRWADTPACRAALRQIALNPECVTAYPDRQSMWSKRHYGPAMKPLREAYAALFDRESLAHAEYLEAGGHVTPDELADIARSESDLVDAWEVTGLVMVEHLGPGWLVA